MNGTNLLSGEAGAAHQRPYIFDLLVQACSVNLDVAQHVQSQGATALCNFCTNDLPNIVRILNQIEREELHLLDSVIPPFQVWFTMQMNTYHDCLVNQQLGQSLAALLNYSSLYPVVALKDIDKLPGVLLK